MSINPPIDIVLDVAKAADPVRYREAVARLNRAAAGAAFDTLIPAPDVGAAESAMAAPALPPPAARTAKTESTFRDFEAMTLATFVEAAIPEDMSAVYGSGTAGETWKSMLASEIARKMADGGGIGIAKRLEAYERLHGVLPAAPGPTAANASPFDPNLLVMTSERGFLGDLDAGEKDG